MTPGQRRYLDNFGRIGSLGETKGGEEGPDGGQGLLFWIRNFGSHAYVRRMLKSFEFCVPTTAAKVPPGPDWLHEINTMATAYGLSAMVTASG